MTGVWSQGVFESSICLRGRARTLSDSSQIYGCTKRDKLVFSLAFFSENYLASFFSFVLNFRDLGAIELLSFSGFGMLEPTCQGARESDALGPVA